MAGTPLIQVEQPARARQQHHHQEEVPTYNRGHVAHGKTLELEIQTQQTGPSTISKERYEHSDAATKLAADNYSENSTSVGGTQPRPQ